MRLYGKLVRLHFFNFCFILVFQFTRVRRPETGNLYGRGWSFLGGSVCQCPGMGLAVHNGIWNLEEILDYSTATCQTKLTGSPSGVGCMRGLLPQSSTLGIPTSRLLLQSSNQPDPTQPNPTGDNKTRICDVYSLYILNVHNIALWKFLYLFGKVRDSHISSHIARIKLISGG